MSLFSGKRNLHMALDKIKGLPFQLWVVTLFRSGVDRSCQKHDPGPGMVGKSQRHRGRARLIALGLCRDREAYCSMGTHPVVLKKP